MKLSSKLHNRTSSVQSNSRRLQACWWVFGWSTLPHGRTGSGAKCRGWSRHQCTPSVNPTPERTMVLNQEDLVLLLFLLCLLAAISCGLITNIIETHGLGAQPCSIIQPPPLLTGLATAAHGESGGGVLIAGGGNPGMLEAGVPLKRAATSWIMTQKWWKIIEKSKTAQRVPAFADTVFQGQNV